MWRIIWLAVLFLPQVARAETEEETIAYIKGLYQEYHQQMFKIARKYEDNPREQEEIVADSIQELFHHQETLCQLTPEQCKAYITEIVKNKAFDLGKKNQIRTKKNRQEQERWQRMQTEDVEERVLKREDLRIVQREMLRLPEKERKALQYKVYDNKKDSEIAALLGISENSVRKYIGRARKKLRKAIE